MDLRPIIENKIDFSNKLLHKEPQEDKGEGNKLQICFLKFLLVVKSLIK